jgi:hypothetical protein
VGLFIKLLCLYNPATRHMLSSRRSDAGCTAGLRQRCMPGAQCTAYPPTRVPAKPERPEPWNPELHVNLHSCRGPPLLHRLSFTIVRCSASAGAQEPGGVSPVASPSKAPLGKTGAWFKKAFAHANRVMLPTGLHSAPVTAGGRQRHPRELSGLHVACPGNDSPLTMLQAVGGPVTPRPVSQQGGGGGSGSGKGGGGWAGLKQSVSRISGASAASDESDAAAGGRATPSGAPSHVRLNSCSSRLGPPAAWLMHRTDGVLSCHCSSQLQQLTSQHVV